MAIGWSLEDCLPVDLDDVLAAAWDMVEAIVELRPGEVTVERTDDRMAEERAADARAFRANLTGTIAGRAVPAHAEHVSRYGRQAAMDQD